MLWVNIPAIACGMVNNDSTSTMPTAFMATTMPNAVNMDMMLSIRLTLSPDSLAKLGENDTYNSEQADTARYAAREYQVSGGYRKYVSKREAHQVG